MADGFEYFTSGDAGAPILHGAAGRMIAVLDWVLVDKGGWEKAFTGTDLAAYRSLSGNRLYLAVDDTQTTYARLRGYRTMSDVTTGTDMFPPTLAALATIWGMGKSGIAGTSAAPRRYWGVRSNRYVLMFAEMHPVSQDGAQRCAFAFGDVPSLCEADLFNTVIMGGSSPQTLYFPQNYLYNGRIDPRAGMNISSTLVSMAATPNGAIAAPTTALVTTVAAPTGIQASDTAALAVTGRLHYQEPQLWSQANAFGGAAVPSYARARLPNLKISTSVIPIPGSLVDLEVITEGEKQLKAIAAINSFSYAYGYSLLEITDTDGML